MFERDQQSKTFGVTVIENLFITEYLPSAKGDHVRVYLALLFQALLVVCSPIPFFEQRSIIMQDLPV